MGFNSSSTYLNKHIHVKLHKVWLNRSRYFSKLKSHGICSWWFCGSLEDLTLWFMILLIFFFKQQHYCCDQWFFFSFGLELIACYMVDQACLLPQLNMQSCWNNNILIKCSDNNYLHIHVWQWFEEAYINHTPHSVRPLLRLAQIIYFFFPLRSLWSVFLIPVLFIVLVSKHFFTLYSYRSSIILSDSKLKLSVLGNNFIIEETSKILQKAKDLQREQFPFCL